MRFSCAAGRRFPRLPRRLLNVTAQWHGTSVAEQCVVNICQGQQQDFYGPACPWSFSQMPLRPWPGSDSGSSLGGTIAGVIAAVATRRLPCKQLLIVRQFLERLRYRDTRDTLIAYQIQGDHLVAPRVGAWQLPWPKGNLGGETLAGPAAVLDSESADDLLKHSEDPKLFREATIVNRL